MHLQLYYLPDDIEKACVPPLDYHKLKIGKYYVRVRKC